MTNHNRFLINGPKNTFIAGKRSLTMKNKSKTNVFMSDFITRKIHIYINIYVNKSLNTVLVKTIPVLYFFHYSIN